MKRRSFSQAKGGALREMESGFTRHNGLDPAMLLELEDIELHKAHQILTLLMHQIDILRQQRADPQRGIDALLSPFEHGGGLGDGEAMVRSMDLADAALMDFLDVWLRTLAQAEDVVARNQLSDESGVKGRLRMPHALARTQRLRRVSNFSAAVLGISNTLGDVLFLTTTLGQHPALFRASLGSQLLAALMRLGCGLRLIMRVDWRNRSKAFCYLRGLLWLIVEPQTGMRVMDDAFVSEMDVKGGTPRVNLMEAGSQFVKSFGSGTAKAYVPRTYDEDLQRMVEDKSTAHPEVVEAANAYAKASMEMYMAIVLGLGDSVAEFVIQVIYLVRVSETMADLAAAAASPIFLFAALGTMLHLWKHVYEVMALLEVRPRLKMKMNFREVSFPPDATEDDVREFAKKAGVIARRIEVVRQDKISASAISALAQHCQGLQYVRFSSCASINDEAVRRLAKWCHGLLEFDVKNCKQITDASLSAIAASCRCLRRLNVAGCIEVTDIGVLDIGRFCRQLHALYLDGCKKVTGAAIEKVAIRCADLGRVGISNLADVSDKTVKQLSLECNITHLCLRNCTKITCNALEGLAQTSPGLKKIELSGCTGLGKGTNTALRLLFKSCSITEVSGRVR